MDHIAFYYFAPVTDPEDLAQTVRRLADGLLGNVLVAHEGINGMLAGDDELLDQFIEGITSSEVLDGAFADMVFKRTPSLRQPFKKFKVRVKREIVPLGIEGFDPSKRVADIKAADVPPEQWRELIQRDDVLVLDNRNSFEWKVGHFEGAVDPHVEEFRDFADYVRDHADEWKAQDTTVAMYCTGGIRCEKASAWMQDLGLQVKQLEGGILNYFLTMPDADADWKGECFVFDDRVTLDTTAHETGKTFEDIPDQFPGEQPESRRSA